MAKSTEKIYAPTVYEMIYFSIIGAGLLVLGVVLGSVKAYDVRNYNYFSTSVRSFVDTQLKFLDSPRWSTILTFVLWMMCGILVYIAIWFVATIIRGYRDDSLLLHGFLTPKGYDVEGEIFTAIARGLIRLVAIVMSVVWLLMLLRSILPYLTHVFAGALSPFTFQTIPTLFAASVLQGAALFLLVVLVRFIFLRKRLITTDIVE